METNNTATPADKGGETVTQTDNGGNTPANVSAENTQTNSTENKPFKVFASQEEFDKHSASILHNAQAKAEKEILAMLGLKPDEKDKIAKFKEAYEATLTDAEKKAKELETLTNETSTLKSAIAEKEAIITAITKATGKKTDDVLKIVKMAKGLVDENTTMEQALEQVFALSGNAKTEPPKTTPTGTPPAEPSADNPESNPFDKKTLNYTEQGRIFKENPAKARALYKAATGKDAPF